MDTFGAAVEVIACATAKHLTLGTAESCTGGLLGGTLTEVPGASDAYLGGCITYTNATKVKLLNVSKETLEAHGAVSSETSHEMAQGCKDRLGCDIAVSVTGIAGPGGGSKEKPVGTVWFGVATSRETKTVLKHFGADLTRSEIRTASVLFGLDLFKAALRDY